MRGNKRRKFTIISHTIKYGLALQLFPDDQLTVEGDVEIHGIVPGLEQMTTRQDLILDAMKDYDGVEISSEKRNIVHWKSVDANRQTLDEQMF